ncbi:MAG TPA: tetratricopeptide repeat protein [Rhizomicrobium sp.]
MPNRLRFAVPLAVLFLGCTALTGSAYAGWFDFGSDKPQTAAKAANPDAKDTRDGKDTKDKVLPAQTLDDSIRQAQMLRLAGSYPDAIKHLSQLMMVAADDPRVVSEYGKTLAAMGRAEDAVNFLNRAQQLSPGDWSVYSALGVAYDQKGDQRAAALYYDRALALQPNEPSVLVNYALSRMLAKDPQGAKTLVARAEAVGGNDPKIAGNIAMIRKMAPADAPVQAVAANAPIQAGPSPAPTARVAQTALPAPQAPMAQSQSLPNAAPRTLMPAADTGVIDVAPQMTPQARDSRVVMQAIPVDPLAGPVVKLHPPKTVAKADAPARPVQTAASQADDLQAKADALAKQLVNKPGAIAAAKTEANKPAVATGAPKVLQPAKAADAKPAQPKVLPPQPVKTAAAKPAKDAIPGLRMSANAY